jgi:hypothetical protein
VRRPLQEKGLWAFTGRERYLRHTWNQDTMAEYNTKVTSLRMSDNQIATICWQWTGKFGPLPLSADVTTLLNLNVLTGKVLKQEDIVQLTCTPPAQLIYFILKGIWSRQQDAANIGAQVRSQRRLHHRRVNILQTPR